MDGYITDGHIITGVLCNFSSSVLPYLYIGVTDDAGFLIPWKAPAVFVGMNLLPPQAFNVSKAELAATLFIADEIK